jgi:antitoxin component YwqK of YwqJK toxin-antitoxin module
MKKGNFKDGLREGAFENYNKRGKVTKRIIYKDDKEIKG